MSARALGFACWAGLVLLHLAWWTLWLPSPHPLPTLALAVLPLLAPLAALRQPQRALLWVGMLCLFYFCHGVAEAWANPAGRAPALLEILLSLGVIAALGWGARGYKRKR